MEFLEKVRPTGINTDVSPEAIELGNDGNRILVNPILDCLNKHYITSENGESFKAENIKGNVQKANSLPAGTNICIGSYEDPVNNRLVFFNYNSNGNHGVYAYAPETGTIIMLIQKTFLNFSSDRRYLVTGIGSVGQLLYWSDGINPQRVINMSRDYTNASFTEGDITLNKFTPTTKLILGALNSASRFPEFDREYDSLLGTNNITDKNFQFTYRIKYLDDEYSDTAPFSDISFADFDPNFFTRTVSWSQNNSYKYNYNNRIQVRHPSGFISLDSRIVKQIEFLVRENNTGNWKIWKTFKSSDPLTAYFTNTEAQLDVDTVSTSKLFEAIPNFSQGLTLHKNRVFLTADEENFDVLDNPTLTITKRITVSDVVGVYSSALSISTGIKTISLPPIGGLLGYQYKTGDWLVFSSSPGGPAMEGYVIDFGPTHGGPANQLVINIQLLRGSGTFSSWTITPLKPNPYKAYWKKNSIQIFGIAVFDQYKRCMGIVSQNKYVVKPNTTFDPTATARDIPSYGSNGNETVDIAVSGNFVNSPKAKFFSIAVTEDQYYQQYCQTSVRVYFYKFDAPTGYSPSGSEVMINDKVFLKNLPTSWDQYTSIYLQVPKDFPVTIDDSWFVRPIGLNPTGADATIRIEKVQKLEGDFVVVNNFGIFNWAAKPAAFACEFFIKRTVPTSEIFYEITNRYPIGTNGSISFTTLEDINGPTYLISRGARDEADATTINKLSPLTYPAQVFNTNVNAPAYIQSIDNTGGFGAPYNPVKDSSNIFFGESPTPTTNSKTIIGDSGTQTLATAKANTRRLINDYTKTAWNQGKPIVDIPDKHAFPRTSVIRFSNKYVQDTNINGLSAFDSADQYSIAYERGPIVKLVNLSSRILAIHQWATTVIYTEEKIIRNTDGNDNLVATGGAIGYDRPMTDGGYGTVHPESIKEVDEHVFGFDVYAGVVWRYTNEGQVSISDFGKKEYFRTLANQILPTKDAVKVIGAIDPFNKEYILTIDNGSDLKVTIAFNYVKNVWTTRYSFVPEMYGTINNKLISFKNGQLWVHNEGSVYNNFYGVQYGSFIKFAINPHVTRVKAALALQIDVESISADVDYKQVEIFTTEGQYSYLKSDEWEKLENVFYASILQDVNTPPATIPGLLALREGDDIRSKYFIIQLNDDSLVKNSLQMFNLSYVMSEYSQ